MRDQMTIVVDETITQEEWLRRLNAALIRSASSAEAIAEFSRALEATITQFARAVKRINNELLTAREEHRKVK